MQGPSQSSTAATLATAVPFVRHLPSLISLVAVALILVHLLAPQLTVDSITLGLAALALLPWMATVLRSAELPGGWKLEFREVQQHLQQQQREIEHLRFLFTNFLTAWEITHLNKLASDQPFRFNRSDSFDNELRRLRALGFIEPVRDDVGIRSMNAEVDGDVKHHFRISDRGRTYLRLRAAFEPTGDPRT